MEGQLPDCCQHFNHQHAYLYHFVYLFTFQTLAAPLFCSFILRLGLQAGNVKTIYIY